jgi:hypothetical protein
LKYASLALASVVCLVALCSTLRVLHPKLETQAAAKAAGGHIRKRLIFKFIIQKTPLSEKKISRPLKGETFIPKNCSTRNYVDLFYGYLHISRKSIFFRIRFNFLFGIIQTFIGSLYID